MARPEQPARGPRKPYQARYRLSVGPCEGLDLSQDRSTLRDEALVQAINCRVWDGIVLTRGGQSLVEEDMNGCVQGLVDVDGLGTRMILAHNERDLLAGIDIFDENLATPNYLQLGDRVSEHPAPGSVSSGTDFEDARPRYCYIWWNGHIIFQNTEDDKLYEVVLPEKDNDLDRIQVNELFLCKVPGEMSTFTISSMVTAPKAGTDQSGEPLYFGTLGGGIVAYANGQLVRLLAEATFSGRVIVFFYNGRLYAAGAQKIQYQTNGWTDGGSHVGTSFSAVSMPAGPVDFRPMCGIEWGGYGWIGGYDDNDGPSTTVDAGHIIKIDDSTGTPVATVAINGYGGGADYLDSVDDFAVGLEGQLFVSFRYNTTSSQFGAVVDWDGSSALDNPPLISIGESNGMFSRIQANNSILYASGGSSSDGVGIWTWDGSAFTQVTDLETLFADQEGNFDMVMF